MFSDLKYRLRALFRRTIDGARAGRGAEAPLGTGDREARRRRHDARRGAAARAARHRRRRAGQGRMPRGPRRRRTGVHGPGRALRPATTSAQARLRGGRRDVAGAGHRRQHGDLHPHRCGPAPHAAHPRSGRAAARVSPADQRGHSRVRVSGIPTASRRESGVRRRGRLRHRQAQRQPRLAASNQRPKDSWSREATSSSSASTRWPGAPLAPQTT